jgi:hypothetical protein
MKPHDERSGAQSDAERRINAETVSAAIEAQSTTAARCELMLRVLARDDTLRRNYVRRRWQGSAR